MSVGTRASEPRGDRRRVDRLIFDPPLRGTIGSLPVEVSDLGMLGTKLRHSEPLDASHVIITLAWDEDVFDVVGLIVRSAQTGAGWESAVEIQNPPAALKRRLELHQANDEIERLRILVEASKLINSSIEADALLSSILTVARQELGVERGTLYFANEAKKEIWSKIAAGLESIVIRLPFGKGLAGYVAESGQHVILHDAYRDSRFDRSLDEKSGFRTRSMLCVPIKNRDGRVVGVLQLLNKKVGSFGESDLDFLDSISDHMAIAMENARLHLDLIEKHRMEQELQLGREIQRTLLPHPPSDVWRTDIAATSRSCYEVGGDYYDFIELSGGELGIAIGDVSGKGVAAALVMSSLQAALRVAAPLESDLSRLVARLNGLLFRSTLGRKYVTFFLGMYDPRSGRLRYVNAGHNPPLLVMNGSLVKLESTGRPIGILPEGEFRETSVTLGDDSALVLYTDGFNEAMNEAEEEFGIPRWESLVRESASPRPAHEIAEHLLATITEFEGNAHANDDKTIVVLRKLRS